MRRTYWLSLAAVAIATADTVFYVILISQQDTPTDWAAVAFFASAGPDAIGQFWYLIDGGHQLSLNVRLDGRQLRGRPTNEEAKQAIVGRKCKQDLIPSDSHLQTVVGYAAPV